MGCESQGGAAERKAFQALLVSMLKGNHIDYVHVEEPDYDARFLRCVELVRQLMGEDEG